MLPSLDLMIWGLLGIAETLKQETIEFFFCGSFDNKKMRKKVASPWD